MMNIQRRKVCPGHGICAWCIGGICDNYPDGCYNRRSAS